MRSRVIWRKTSPGAWLAALLLICAVTATGSAPANAQLTGNLNYVTGYNLVPNPPTTNVPTTLILYGFYPAGCGSVEEASVTDPSHVVIRLHSSAACDSGGGWSASFALGLLPLGNHTVAITMTMERADSGSTVYEGALTFGVQDTSGAPPPTVPSLLTLTTTDPWPPTPDRPMTLILGGIAPFDCPVVSVATVIDTTHIELTLSPGPACGDTVAFWSHRFDLGIQREGWHFMDLAITFAGGDTSGIHHLPVEFLVVHDTTGWGPPPVDSLETVMSRSRPNPFATESRFSVSLDTGADADVSVFDINGRRVSTVFRGRLAAGTTELAWNGRRSDGSRVAAGVYFYRLEMRGRVVSRRLVLLRQ